MFCDGCGSALQTNQAFCSLCGKRILGQIGAGATPSWRGRVQKHIHLLAILWFAFSALNGLGGMVLVILGTTLFPYLREMKDVPPDLPVSFLSALFTSLGILILAKAALGFVAGRGLMHADAWARVITLVLAFISLINVPFGTALGVYTLWVLLPEQSQREYDALIAARGEAPA